MKVSNINLLSAPVTLDQDQELPTVYVGNIYSYSIQLVFSGTPAGTFKLQCSNDEGNITGSNRVVQTSTVTNWTDIADSDQVISAAGNHTWNVQNCAYMWMRVVYVDDSGSGSLDKAHLVVKGV